MEFIDEALIEYAIKNSSEESDLLKILRKETNQKILHPRMLSSTIQGRFLSFISKLIMPKNILEIGTYTGYGTLCLSEGLQKNGKIHTIEINEELKDFQNHFFRQSDFENQINQHVGNAMNIIEQINEEFDIVFLDADKSNYLNYMNLILPRLKKGGVLISDNVLWSGKVLQKPEKNDLDTRALQKFNITLKNHSELETVLLPIRDGLSLSRKL
jgi:predicted O-methyltransferase YrrM|tara:strand:+ start:25 stop:666 length:642 start_codon:yes stop_codon:yes gene_type:complete